MLKKRNLLDVTIKLMRDLNDKINIIPHRVLGSVNKKLLSLLVGAKKYEFDGMGDLKTNYHVLFKNSHKQDALVVILDF